MSCRAPGLCVIAAGLLALAVSSGAHAADEGGVQLRDASYATTVRAYCAVCHSLDYIQTNAPFLKRAGWEAEVRKMIKVMGATVPDAEVAHIVDYLTQQYGSQ